MPKTWHEHERHLVGFKKWRWKPSTVLECRRDFPRLACPKKLDAHPGKTTKDNKVNNAVNRELSILSQEHDAGIKISFLLFSPIVQMQVPSLPNPEYYKERDFHGMYGLFEAMSDLPWEHLKKPCFCCPKIANPWSVIKISLALDERHPRQNSQKKNVSPNKRPSKLWEKLAIQTIAISSY